MNELCNACAEFMFDPIENKCLNYNCKVKPTELTTEYYNSVIEGALKYSESHRSRQGIYNIKPSYFTKLIESKRLDPKKHYKKEHIYIILHTETKILKIFSCDENYHSGDSYNEDTTELIATTEDYRQLYSDLYEKCLEKAKKEALESLVNERVHEILMSKCLEKP